MKKKQPKIPQKAKKPQNNNNKPQTKPNKKQTHKTNPTQNKTKKPHATEKQLFWEESIDYLVLFSQFHNSYSLCLDIWNYSKEKIIN